MPLPKPTKGESKEAFMSRCIRAMKDEGNKHSAAVAICLSQWNKKKSGNKSN